MKQTSREAYQYTISNLPTIRATILSVMKPDHLYTFRDLAMKTGLRTDQVWKRLSEMRDNDQTIIEAGIVRCRITGGKVTAWKIKNVNEVKF